MKSILIIASVAILMSGCGTSPTRIQAGGQQAITTMGVDLADFRATAGNMVALLLAHPSITRFEAEHGRLPVLDRGKIVNKSDMHLDLMQIAGRIEEDLLNSGQIELIANDGFAGDTNERADFYLEGEIGMLAARDGRLREKTYTFQLRLNNSSTRRTVWQRSEDVSKQGTRSNISW